MRWILASASPRRRELLAQLGLTFDIIPAKGEEISCGATPEEMVLELSRAKAQEVAAVPAKKTGSVHAHAGRPSSVSDDDTADGSGKEKDGSRTEEDCCIIAADTIVVIDGEVLGKPAGEEDAVRTLSRLQGRTHQVYTGVTILRRNRDPGLQSAEQTVSFAECTGVTFAPMTPEEIRAYAATGEPMDKAGSYGIQGRGGAYIQSIRGDYYNVVGLPLCRLRQELQRMELL